MRPFLRHPTVGLVTAIVSLSLAASACSSEPGPSDSVEPQTEVPEGPSYEGWETIITGDWSLVPGTEGYTCVRQTVDEDLYIGGFEAISPTGTHHTLLTVGEPSAPDGLEACSAAVNFPLQAFGSGVGPERLELPEGVALRIPKGSQLLLNLHLYNTGDEEIRGTSGTMIRRVAEADVEHVAEAILAGTLRLEIPAGQTTVHTGTCTLPEPGRLFAVAPHMHQAGIHERVFVESSVAGEVKVHDAPYDFDDQSFRMIEPVDMAAGDKLRIECTHRNDTSETITFGDSSDAEMCFAGVYRYPAGGGFFICADDSPFAR